MVILSFNFFDKILLPENSGMYFMILSSRLILLRSTKNITAEVVDTTFVIDARSKIDPLAIGSVCW